MDISDLIGQPFDEYGLNGYNCYSLCQEVYKRAGIRLPSWNWVADLSLRSETIKNAKRLFIELSEPEPYCLVVFKLHPRFCTHIGIMLDRLHFLHVMKKRNVCLERIDNPYWQKRIDGYYKYGTNLRATGSPKSVRPS